jgi:uncharacterized protein involved in response to NO
MANIAFHLRNVLPSLGPISERMALSTIALLIAVMGGRLVPSFTRNWIAQNRIAREPMPYGRLDTGVSAFTAGVLVLWQVFPRSEMIGDVLMLAGVGALLRLVRWRGWYAWREPLVWVLHLGYLWLAFGFILLGLSLNFPAAVPQTGAIHALTAGAIGVTTLAMMTRTTLSHTGRTRRVGSATVAAYLLVNAAALTRVLASFSVGFDFPLLTASGVLWSAAFGIFTVVYGPMLVSRKGAPAN